MQFAATARTMHDACASPSRLGTDMCIYHATAQSARFIRCCTSTATQVLYCTAHSKTSCVTPRCPAVLGLACTLKSSLEAPGSLQPTIAIVTQACLDSQHVNASPDCVSNVLYSHCRSVCTAYLAQGSCDCNLHLPNMPSPHPPGGSKLSECKAQSEECLTRLANQTSQL